MLGKLLIVQKEQNLNELGGIFNLTRTINYIRRKEKNLFNSIIDILQVPIESLVTNRGSLFYKYGPEMYLDEVKNSNIVIFFNDNMLNELAVNKLCAIDGSFSVTSKNFMQLYTISF